MKVSRELTPGVISCGTTKGNYKEGEAAPAPSLPKAYVCGNCGRDCHLLVTADAAIIERTKFGRIPLPFETEKDNYHQLIACSCGRDLPARRSDVRELRVITRKRKAWFSLRMSRILFAAKHSWTTLRMKRLLFIGSYSQPMKKKENFN